MQLLASNWAGKAIQAPLGPTVYDIDFTQKAKGCVKGIANNNFSHHHWPFCNATDQLTLEFLSDFRGNDRSIRLKLIPQESNISIFRAESHPFMDVVVDTNKDEVEIRIMHYDKLHVKIVLMKTLLP